MDFQQLFATEKEERRQIIERLIEDSYPGTVFFTMIGIAVIMATIGLILDRVSLIIGSMLVAPFLSPILSLGVGIVLSDFELLQRSLRILGKALLVTILVSFVITIFIRPETPLNQSILSRGHVDLAFLYVAIASGFAASLALAHKGLSEFLVGVAVSVALLPPLANVGIGLGTFNFSLATGSFQLFFINLLGVVFGSIVVFSLMGFFRERKIAHEAIEEEKKKLEEENHPDNHSGELQS